MFNARWLPFRWGRESRQLAGEVIFNADDFGRSREINQAVVQAHRRGVLTSTSLMVTGEMAQEAVALARQLPELAVGLHLVLVDGRPALPPQKIPHLVDGDGRFPRNPWRAAGRYLLLGRDGREELQREVAAQFERFTATGLPLSHVDGHCHLHVHPFVFRCLLPMIQRYDVPAIRLPRDDLLIALRHNLRRASQGSIAALLLGWLCAWHAWRLRRRGIAAVDRTYGVLASGRMRESYVLDILSRLSSRSAEIYFHPTTGGRLDSAGPNPRELEVLLSPAVQAAIMQGQVRLTNYLQWSRSQRIRR